jgi:CheY-like chemotaxis protein
MSNRSKAQILVVDDDPRARESLGTLLMCAGYDVAMAENGASALLHLSRVLPDLIITDLNMPQMSGMELMSLVRARYPSMSIVAMSGDYQGEGVAAGIIADSFYPKGQDPNNLLTTIANLIAANPARWNAQESRPQSRLRPALDS